MRGNVSPLAEDQPEDGWVDGWVDAEAKAQAAIAATVAPGSASALVRDAYAAAGEADIVFVASSMPVRDLEWFGAPRLGAKVLSNRGANGIDGLVSTAAGVAWAQPSSNVTALLGDLGFLHDSGGLRAAAGLENLRFVVIDNDGGAIFDFLPQATSLDGETFNQLFTTPHGLDLAGTAAAVPGVNVDIVKVDQGAAVATHRAVHAAVAAALA